MNGEVIETWWFLGNNVVSRSNSDRLFSTTTTNPTRLIISASYTGADAGVYTCGNTNPLSATSARDMITLNAQGEYVAFLVNYLLCSSIKMKCTLSCCLIP